MDMEKTGNYIKDKRKLKGWSQEELAEKVGVSPRTIGTWESGKGSIKPDNALNLAECLGISLQELFYGRDLDNIDPKEKAEFDQWIKEINKITIDLEGRSITTMDVATSAFGVSLISAALAMWAIFEKSLILVIACLVVGILGVLFIAVGKRTITVLNNKLNERKDKISMS